MAWGSCKVCGGRSMVLNQRNCVLLFAASMALAWGSAATASVTLLTNPAQLSTTYTNNFESVRDSGPVTWTSGNLELASGDSSGVTTSGVQGLASVSYPGTLEANLAGGYSTVGLFFGNDDTCCSQGFDAILSVYNGATLLGSVNVTANMNDYVDQFIGLSSTTPFNRVTVSYGANTNLYTYIDDFQLGAPVPEPSTWAMMLFGFGGIGVAMRLSKRRSRALRLNA